MVHGSQGHVGHRVTSCFFSSETWVTGSQNWVTYVTRATSVTLVDGSQGHVGHVEFFLTSEIWVTETQDWVTYVTWGASIT